MLDYTFSGPEWANIALSKYECLHEWAKALAHTTTERSTREISPLIFVRSSSLRYTVVQERKAS